MKYIDAEKLKYEIERLEMAWKAIADNAANSNMRNFYDGGVEICKELLGKVDSLQQEQPEVDLEKFTEKIKTFQGRYNHPEIVSIKGAMAFMARMFYQYPNVARQWYDSLPKVTQDKYNYDTDNNDGRVLG